MAKDIVTMPRSAYMAEHRGLIKLLDSAGKALKAEASKQKREVIDERRKRKIMERKSK